MVIDRLKTHDLLFIKNHAYDNYERELSEFLAKVKARLLWRKYVAEKDYVSLNQRYPRLVN